MICGTGDLPLPLPARQKNLTLASKEIAVELVGSFSSSTQAQAAEPRRNCPPTGLNGNFLAWKCEVFLPCSGGGGGGGGEQIVEAEELD
jgi:hypothetical protein